MIIFNLLKMVFINYISKFQRSHCLRGLVDKLAFEFIWCIYIYNIVYRESTISKPMVQLVLLQLKLSGPDTVQE